MDEVTNPWVSIYGFILRNRKEPKKRNLPIEEEDSLSLRSEIRYLWCHPPDTAYTEPSRWPLLARMAARFIPSAGRPFQQRAMTSLVALSASSKNCTHSCLSSPSGMSKRSPPGRVMYSYGWCGLGERLRHLYASLCPLPPLHPLLLLAM